MDKYSLSGAIVHIGDTQEVGKKGFKKREIVIETTDKYPQKVKMEAIGEMIDTLDQYSDGQEVTAHFNIRGNEYNGNFYVNLQVWRMEEYVDPEIPADPADELELTAKTSKAKAEPVEYDMPF